MLCGLPPRTAVLPCWVWDRIDTPAGTFREEITSENSQSQNGEDPDRDTDFQQSIDLEDSLAPMDEDLAAINENQLITNA